MGCRRCHGPPVSVVLSARGLNSVSHSVNGMRSAIRAYRQRCHDGNGDREVARACTIWKQNRLPPSDDGYISKSVGGRPQMTRSEATLVKYSSGPKCIRFVADLETVANDEFYLASGWTIVD
jgi:hypothetical protein